MNCQDLQGLFELYVLGLLGEPEREEAEEHLKRNCPNCTEELRRARALNAQFTGSLSIQDPPARLRQRVLASIGAKTENKSRLAWLPWALAALPALLVGIYFTGQLRERDEQIGYRDALMRDREDSRQRALAQVKQLEAAIALLSEPDTRQVTFGKGPQGRVLVNPRRGVLLVANNLPPVGPDKTYQFWLIPKGGAPQPAGLFQSEEAGNALVLVERPIDLATTAAVAVSVEPASGSAAPTTTPIIVAPLSD